MKLHGGIDLHSNSSVVALSGETDRVLYLKRSPNDAETVLDALAPSSAAAAQGYTAAQVFPL